jgi:hypothetical protein
MTTPKDRDPAEVAAAIAQDQEIADFIATVPKGPNFAMRVALARRKARLEAAAKTPGSSGGG